MKFYTVVVILGIKNLRKRIGISIFVNCQKKITKGIDILDREKQTIENVANLESAVMPLT